MPKVARQIDAKNLARKVNLKPQSLIWWFARFLSLIGKPFYFVLSHLIIAIAFILFIIGHFVIATFEFLQKRAKKLKFPKITLPRVDRVIKLEGLRVNLFELKILQKIKKKFTIKISRFQKLRLKKKITLSVIFLLIVAVITYTYISIFRGLPAPSELTKKAPQVSTKIYDRNGNLLYKIYKDENRTIVPLDKIPPHVRFATLAAEDAEFYSHPGFSVRGMMRALIQDVQTGSLQGGSTITQQLVKNVLLSPEKTFVRKIKELILSVEVEFTYTKDQILEMYLNEVSYGGTAYGIEEASQSYFGKDVKDLSLGEAAYLAGLTKSPTLFSPYGQDPESGFARQKEVLDLMVINKFITKSQEEEALAQKLTFIPNKTEMKAPHFVMYVRSLLVDKYGEDMVEKGGLEVTTSLDLPIQEISEQMVKNEVDKLKGLNVGNGAAMVTNPKTGEILAMVGSKDYFDTNYDGQVNVTTSIRQPGSSIKVVNYAYALSHGFSPASIIDDSPVTYKIAGSPLYTPVNYDGKFRGKITIRSALAQSRNIPAVKILASYGVDNMVQEGRDLGITTWEDPANFGLSLTLGGGAVKMADMTKVYSALANGGKTPSLLAILSVKDYQGRTLEKNSPKVTQAIDQRVAFLLTDILKDNPARAPEFGLNSYLVIKDHPEVAVKTGTSNDLRDNWTIGYNQDFLVAVWVGNNDNSPMSRVASGVTGASPIWNKIMSFVLNDKPSIDWKAPDGVSKVNICSLTATLPCDACPTRQEWFLDENKPTRSCTEAQINQIKNPPSPNPADKILDSGASTQSILP